MNMAPGAAPAKGMRKAGVGGRRGIEPDQVRLSRDRGRIEPGRRDENALHAITVVSEEIEHATRVLERATARVRTTVVAQDEHGPAARARLRRARTEHGRLERRQRQRR